MAFAIVVNGARGDEVSPLARIEIDRGDQLVYPIDGDGFHLIGLADDTTACASTSFAGAHVPSVIVRFEDGRYQVAADLMRKPPPTKDALRAVAEAVWDECHIETEDGYELKSPGTWGVGASLWGTLMDLLDAGHEALALEFFEMAWPPWAADKSAALAHSQDFLMESGWWQQLAAKAGLGQKIEDDAPAEE